MATEPTRLGAFEITGLLGEGGSALVYAARDGEQEVALKVLHPDLGLDDRQVTRFLEEAERMRRVEHPALVPVLGAGSLPGGRPYIVMPRLQGRTLAASLQDGPLPPERALRLFEDVAYGVAALHTAGLVHRDIKPENVFWSATEDRLILLDLGISRDTEKSPSTTTQGGLMRGTPAYMAPERLFGQPATVRSDLYELALLLWIMLTGRLPWDEGDPAARMSPKLRPEHLHLVPPSVATALADALSLDVNRRPASVAALLGRVRRAFANATPQGASPRGPAEEPAGLAHQATQLQPFTPQAGPSPQRPPDELSSRTTSASVYAQSGANHSVPPTLGSFGPPAVIPIGHESASAPTAASRADRSDAALPPQARSATVAAVPRGRSLATTAGIFALGAVLAGGLVWAAPLLRREPEVRGVMTALEPTSAIDELSHKAVTPAPPAPSESAVATPSASASSSAESASSSKPAGGPVKEGTLPASVIESRVKARIGAMQACMHGEIERNPGFQGGRVTMNFWIGLDGSVTQANGKSDLPPPVVQCVLGQLRTVRFPPPVGGPVNVIFPIVFKTPASSPPAPGPPPNGG